MSRAAHLCEHPAHIGSRVVTRADLLEERTEWRRLSDQGREFVRIQRRVCRTCAIADAKPYDRRQTSLL